VGKARASGVRRRAACAWGRCGWGAHPAPRCKVCFLPIAYFTKHPSQPSTRASATTRCALPPTSPSPLASFEHNHTHARKATTQPPPRSRHRAAATAQPPPRSRRHRVPMPRWSLPAATSAAARCRNYPRLSRQRSQELTHALVSLASTQAPTRARKRARHRRRAPRSARASSPRSHVPNS